MHYLDTDTFAGTEQHVLTLMRALTEAGERCSLVCREETELAGRAQQMSFVQVYPIPCWGMRASVQDLAECVRNWSPDLLHAHNGRTMLQCAWLADRSGQRLKAIYTQHFVDPAHASYRGIKRLLANRMHRWVDVRIARVIAVSEAARREALTRDHLKPDRIVTIYNGLEPPAADAERVRGELNIEPGTRLIVTVGRLSEEKGHRVLLRAIPSIVSRFPTARFLWVGTGDLEEQIRSEVENEGLGGVVTFLGHRKDAHDFIALADLLVAPSLKESFGLVLAEAMMIGTPVVATNCGGPYEIVYPARPAAPGDQAVGWLVQPCDPEALAEAVCEALSDPEAAMAMADRGKERACRFFTAKTMAARTIALYKEALEAR
jgi:glycosyltransferase involved in cell wall biosynthesis